MSDKSKFFEKQISRIYQLLEDSGAVVTWDDKMLDPDNPEQFRQIDISIKKDGVITHVECRDQKSKQDVKWVEELIGRKVSLNVDCMIAVSASGFTDGAIKKAEVYGVVLRDLKKLTASEVVGWGKKTRIWLHYYEYMDVEFITLFGKQDKPEFPYGEVLVEFNKSGLVFDLLQDLSQDCDLKNIGEEYICVKKEHRYGDLVFCGKKVKGIFINARVRLLKKEVFVPSVITFDNPGVSNLQREIRIESDEIGFCEIIKTNEIVGMVVDLSKVSIPNNCFYHSYMMDLGDVMKIRSMKEIGLPEFKMSLDQAKLVTGFV